MTDIILTAEQAETIYAKNRRARAATRAVDNILDNAVVPAPPPPTVPPISDLLYGVYVNNGYNERRAGGVNIAAHEALIGQAVDQIVDFVPAEDITMSGWSPLWEWTQMDPPREATMIGVPMLMEPTTGDYAVLASKLAPGTIVRLGWEMNGTWFTWSTSGNDGWFVGRWIEIYNAMKNINPSLAFCWNPTLGDPYPQGVPFNPIGAYPGNEHVDLIGLDVYDNRWGATNNESEEQRWDTILNQWLGLRFYESFAFERGKLLCFPEWGTELDSGLFVNNMLEFIHTNEAGSRSASYWDYDATDMHSAFRDNPTARAVYQQEFVG